MFTTPKKATRFRPHPYNSPVTSFGIREIPTVSPRSSPGGPTLPSTTPFPSPRIFQTPTPRKRYYAAGNIPSTPSPMRTSVKGHHRVGVRHARSQTPLRKQRAPFSPGRPSSVPTNLHSNPPFATISQETLHAVQQSRLPLTQEDRIFVEEMERLTNSHSFATALADARQAVDRAAEVAPILNAEIEAKSECRLAMDTDLADEREHADARRKALLEAKAKEEKHRAEQERLRQEQARADRERRLQEERNEEHRRYQENLAEMKRRRIEREQQEMEAAPHCDAVPCREEPAAALPEERMQTEQDQEADAQRRVQEEAERVRLAAELQAMEDARFRFEAQQEEARRQAIRAQEELRQAEEDRRRANEERMRAQQQRMCVEEERLRVEKEQEEIRRIQQEAARAKLAAQLKAEEEASQQAARAQAEIQARIQAQQEAFARQQADARYRAEREDARAWAEQRARLEEMARLEAELEARIRAAREAEQAEEAAFYANRERTRLYEQYQQQQYAQQQYQQQQQGFANSSQHQYNNTDIPMREPSTYIDMDASMHSLQDGTPYADEPPPVFCAPPPPPTDAERFAIYEAKWEAFQSEPNLLLTFDQLPWPVLHDIDCIAGITRERVHTFVFDPKRPGFAGKGHRARVRPEILRYHPDKFENLMAKIRPDQREIVREGVLEVARFLVEFKLVSK
ncbi:hypothetical protein BDZ97DRAFT_1119117 [Flammula alnicola]|nr:hypothetical protein BDZ97DRAFT_1119117 [Flammula alnicola]